jgi:hypothetical protein
LIAKHISMKSTRKSDFLKLVNYITNPQQKSERVGEILVMNCHTDRPDAAVLEVLNTQAQNTRAASDKTYHLIVSFRAGEEPDAKTLLAVEAQLCEGLGYGEHQRVSAVHYDTDNVHLHIAINKIHPKRHTIHNPYNDHKTLAQLCEKLERDYGLEPDNHRAQRTGAENRAQDMERHAGVESLLGWIKRECLEQIQGAQSWDEMHRVLRDNGLEIRERANGLVITDGRTTVKASSLSRDLSKAKLEARLGAFQAALELGANKPLRRYEARPVRTRVNASKLYDQYRAEQERCHRERQAQLLAARKRKTQAIEATKRTWRLKRSAIKLIASGGIGKKALYSLAAKSLRDQIRKVVNQYSAERADIQQRNRREAWADWLRRKATEGDGTALAALRAREATQGLKGNTLTGQGRQIHKGADATLDSVTKKGTVIYRVGTAVVRDDGVRLAVSRKTTDASLETALRMAIERYGTRLTVTGSEEFKEKIATVAAAKRLPVTFADAALEKQRRSLASSGRFEVGGGGAKSLDEGAQNGIEGFGIVKVIKHTTRKHRR